MALIVDPRGLEAGVLRRLVDFEGMNVLDVGCGEGRTARRIARTAASVVGIDPDAERIALARAAVPARGARRPEFLVEDVVTIDLRPGRFDAVIFTRSL